ncbi:hypothetical protein N2603_01360 [Bradyrhizobium huanghuaihaiense]|nr:hypothetical protein [Bradyrhizobium sp. CB3035]UWU77149.1 hypothetical protein N2603_01360 [Bradyrhizobium sp. CB3035]
MGDNLVPAPECPGHAEHGEIDMRKIILVAAMVLASASAQAGDRSHGIYW